MKNNPKSKTKSYHRLERLNTIVDGQSLCRNAIDIGGQKFDIFGQGLLHGLVYGFVDGMFGGEPFLQNEEIDDTQRIRIPCLPKSQQMMPQCFPGFAHKRTQIGFPFLSEFVHGIRNDLYLEQIVGFLEGKGRSRQSLFKGRGCGGRRFVVHRRHPKQKRLQQPIKENRRGDLGRFGMIDFLGDEIQQINIETPIQIHVEIEAVEIIGIGLGAQFRHRNRQSEINEDGILQFVVVHDIVIANVIVDNVLFL